MDAVKEWIPLITSALMLAFGGMLWAMVRGILKSFDSFLNTKAPKIDLWTEKYMGDQGSDEMWRQIRSVGESLVDISDRMIERDSFQKDVDSESDRPPEPFTDLSGKLSKSDQ